MDQPAKDAMLAEAKTHLAAAQSRIKAEIKTAKARRTAGTDELRALEVESEDIRMIQEALLARGERTLEDLEKLLPSPYFMRCDIRFEGDTAQRPYYFAKFSLSDQGIYSWTTPVASIRYEEPGPIAYETPEDGLRQGTLERKDQYMIVDGKIIFLASEAVGRPRELVHQEYLSAKRGGFVLPEIVAQMEKAQDQVIRAHHAGPFVISGPAGSGKTTLALHRVAYLTQSPETSRLYPPRSIMVFVQDAGTKDYFSHLLPELGIRNIRITTFDEWVFEVLNIKDATYVTRLGETEDERDRYEYAKIQALSAPLGAYRKGGEWALLEKSYAAYLDEAQLHLLAQQKAARQFDRYDLTLLALAFADREDGFPYIQDVSYRLKTGEARLRHERRLREYPLILVDEFQNYLPQQLRLFARTLKKHPGSMLYVGDIAQRTRFGTISSLADIDTVIHPERTVRLQKVYRNTQRILEYIRGLGFVIDIPEGVKEGVAVVEQSVEDTEQEVSYLKELATERPGTSIGVLAKDPHALAQHKAALANYPGIRCMGIREAQGVELDVVCLLGDPADFLLPPLEGTAFATEQTRINQDLLYVALTRAISELHVLRRKAT